MKWMKHVTDSIDDPKIARVRAEFGNEGYAVYWIILEVIARHFTGKNPSSSMKFPRKIWQNYCGISPKKLRNFLEFYQNEGLLLHCIEGENITIKVPNLLKYSDEYTRKQRLAGRNPDADLSGHYPDSVRASSSTSTSNTLPRDNTTYLDSTTWAEYESEG